MYRLLTVSSSLIILCYHIVSSLLLYNLSLSLSHSLTLSFSLSHTHAYSHTHTHTHNLHICQLISYLLLTYRDRVASATSICLSSNKTCLRPIDLQPRESSLTHLHCTVHHSVLLIDVENEEYDVENEASFYNVCILDSHCICDWK